MTDIAERNPLLAATPDVEGHTVADRADDVHNILGEALDALARAAATTDALDAHPLEPSTARLRTALAAATRAVEQADACCAAVDL